MNTNDIDYLKTRYPEYLERAEKSFWRNFILLTLDSAAFTFAMTMFSVDTILPYFVSLLTKSPILVGLVPAVYFLGYYTPQLFGAYLANLRTRRKPLILGIIISQRLGIFMIALTAQFMGALSPQVILALFFISFLFFSFFNGLVGPAYSDFIGKNIIRRRGFFYGVTFAVSGVMGLLSSLIAKYFLDRFGSPLNFQVVFWLGFGLSFFSPIILSGLRETELPYKLEPEGLGTFFRQIPSRLRATPLFVRYVIVRALLGLGIMGNSFFAVHAMRKFEMTAGNLGLFTMIILLAQGLFSLVWGWIGDRFGYKVVLLVAGVFIAIEAILALTAPAAWVFFIISALMGGVYSAMYISDPNFVFELVPPEQTSRFLGISNTLLAPVGVLAPLLGGWLVEMSGYPGLFVTIFFIGLAGMLGVWWVVKEPRIAI
ncbi:MAG: MFS transporter [Chloroflexota bacterium]